MENQDIFLWLNQVRCNNIPAESTRSTYDQRLGRWIFGNEEFAEEGKSLAEDVDEGTSDVRFTVGKNWWLAS